MSDEEQRPQQRVVEQRLVCYVCQRCGAEQQEWRWPGPTPKYCPDCKPVVAAEKNRARVRKHRAKWAPDGEERT